MYSHSRVKRDKSRSRFRLTAAPLFLESPGKSGPVCMFASWAPEEGLEGNLPSLFSSFVGTGKYCKSTGCTKATMMSRTVRGGEEWGVEVREWVRGSGWKEVSGC